jgi:hypothetical protein
VAGCCLLRCLIFVSGVEGSEAWFLLGLQGEWFLDTAGLGELRGGSCVYCCGLGGVLRGLCCGLVRLLFWGIVGGKEV